MGNDDYNGRAALAAVMALARSLEDSGALSMDDFLERLGRGADAVERAGDEQAAKVLRAIVAGTKTALHLEQGAGRA